MPDVILPDIKKPSALDNCVLLLLSELRGSENQKFLADGLSTIVRQFETGVDLPFMRSVARARYEVAHSFESLVQTLIAQLPLEHPVAVALSANLAEENGTDGYGPVAIPHSEGRRRLLDFLHISYPNDPSWDYDAWGKAIPSHPATAQFLTAYERIVNGDPLFAAGALTHYEGHIPLEYTAFLHGLERAFPSMIRENYDYPPTHPFWHIAAHAVRDVEHEQKLAEALVHSVQTPEDLELIRAGFLASQKLWAAFWSALTEELLLPDMQRTSDAVRRILIEPDMEKPQKPSKILRGLPNHLDLTEGAELIDYDQRPQYLMMNLETGCPLNCQKCAQPGRNRAMEKPLSLEERTAILKLAASIGARELVIIGAGEPTVHRNFTQLVQPVITAAHGQGMGTILFTTGLGLTHDQALFYRDHDVTLFISLDSLNPETYRTLMGGGNLPRVLKNIAVLREVYGDTPTVLPDGRKLLRLAINVTVQKGNFDELPALKAFTDDDMQMIANVPMPEGKLRTYQNWETLVGNPENFERLKMLAAAASETGSHSSVVDGVCSYFNRGISVDSDGQFLTCSYASDTAEHLGNVRDALTPDSLLMHYKKMRATYRVWCEELGYNPSCPLRDPTYEAYIRNLDSTR